MAGTPKFSKKVSAHCRRFLYGLRGASVSSTAWSSGATLRLSRPYTCDHTCGSFVKKMVIVLLFSVGYPWIRIFVRFHTYNTPSAAVSQSPRHCHTRTLTLEYLLYDIGSVRPHNVPKGVDAGTQNIPSR